MTAILFILAVALAMVLGFSLIRSIQAYSRNPALSGFVNYVVAFAVAVAFWLWRGGPESWLLPSIIGVSTGVVYASALLLIMRSMGQRGLAMTNAIGSTAQVFPVMIAIALGDRPGAMRIAGIVVAVSAMPLLALATAAGRAVRERPSLRLAALMFVMQGAAMSGNLVAFEVLDPVSLPFYVAVLFGTSSIVTLVAWRLSHQPAGPGDVRRGVTFGLVNVASTQFMLIALSYVTASVLYASIGPLGMLINVVIAAWLWHERVHAWGWAGFAMALIATVLLNI